MEKKIDRAAIDAAIEAAMEQACENCHHLYTGPNAEEAMTGQCSQCESCRIEAKIREAVAFAESQVSMVFAGVIADAIADHFKEGRPKWND